MVHYNPHIIGQYNPLYQTTNQVFFIAHIVLDLLLKKTVSPQTKNLLKAISNHYPYPLVN